MANTWNGTPLDEVQFRRPDVIAYWEGIHENSSMRTISRISVEC